jgi:hypothetical protein
MTLTKNAIADLRRFCEWLDTVPRKSVYPSHVGLITAIHKVEPCPEDTLYWLSDGWKLQRKYADAIFYASGWGWRLRKHWKERLAQLESELCSERES